MNAYLSGYWDGLDHFHADGTRCGSYDVRCHCTGRPGGTTSQLPTGALAAEPDADLDEVLEHLTLASEDWR